MTYQELLQLKHQRAEKVQQGKVLLEKKDFDAHKTLMGEVEEMNNQIEAYEKQLREEGLNPVTGEQVAGKAFGPMKGGEETGYEKAVKELAAAARAGFPKAKAGEMMNEGTGSDGGYTVPQDIVNKIIARRESKESLLNEIRVVNVTTESGARTFKKRSQHTGFLTVAEGAAYGKKATPQFERVEYKIEKRGGVLPVTVELMEDSDANIAAVIEGWMGDEARATINKEVIDVIAEKEQQNLVDLDGILKAWIGLGSQFRATSKLITNDDGLLWLSTLKDVNGRYMLTPNPADPHALLLCAGPHVLPIKTYDNDTIPSAGTKIPVILGDLKEGIAYWDRRKFTLTHSNTAVVGDLNAFEDDLILWKGSLRDDCTIWDEEAFVYGYIDIAADTSVDEPADNTEEGSEE